MPRGGKRAGAGRKPFSKDKAAAGEVQTLSAQAREHTNLALSTLVRIAKKSESDAAAKAAADSILDRGYGRPMQSMEHTGAGGGPIKHDLSGLPDEQLSQLRDILGSLAVVGRGERGNSSEGGGKER